jgi:hypothetical protein
MTDRRGSAALLAVGTLVLVAGCSGGHGGVAAGAKTGVNTSGATSGSGAGLNASAQGGAKTGVGAATAQGQSTVNGGASGSQGAGAPSGAAPGNSPQPTPKATEVPLNASLSKTCVTDGQTLTLTMHAEPHMGVVFDTNYPDGKDGQVHGGFDSRGRTDLNGTYTSTWTIGPGTAPGPADVELAAVAGNYHTGHQRLPFTIALTCP